MNNIKEKEILYLKYKYNYYVGNQLVDDIIFDELEHYLKMMNSQFVNIVDAPIKSEIKKLNYFSNKEIDEIFGRKENDRKERIKHISPMLSLQKIQVECETELPKHEIELFLNRLQTYDYIETSPKMDGNSMELIYENGVLVRALTRGDKIFGIDKMDRVKYIVPNNINLNGTVEIRGELIIKTKLWESKYSDPNKVDNPRNWIAGVLNKEEFSIDVMNDITFVAFSIVLHENNKKLYIDDTMKVLNNLGFNTDYEPLVFKFKTFDEFKDIYFKYKYYRENVCEYLLDGIVLKYPENKRNILGENHKEPKWACAVKFIAKETITEVIDIEWNMSKDGYFCPVLILKPVELDGVIATRASGHNLGFLINNNCFVGATISLMRSGDIIPSLKTVIKPSPDSGEYIKYYESILNS